MTDTSVNATSRKHVQPPKYRNRYQESSQIILFLPEYHKKKHLGDLIEIPLNQQNIKN